MAMLFDAASLEYVTVPTNFAALLGTASMTCRIKTTQVGASAPWQSPCVSGWEQVGQTNETFWGTIDQLGKIGMGVGNGKIASISNVNDGVWHAVGFSRNAVTGFCQTFFDGVLEASGTQWVGISPHPLSYIAYNGDSGGTPHYLDGELADLCIYDRVLTANEFAAKHAQGGGDRIFDGLVHRYRFEEDAPGVVAAGAGSVIDDVGGNNGTPQATPEYSAQTARRIRVA